MEWLKGKTHLPVCRQILSEICRRVDRQFVAQRERREARTF